MECPRCEYAEGPCHRAGTLRITAGILGTALLLLSCHPLPAAETGWHEPAVETTGEIGAPCNGLALSLRLNHDPTHPQAGQAPLDLVVVNVSQKPISVLTGDLCEFTLQFMLFDAAGKGVSPTDFSSAFWGRATSGLGPTPPVEIQPGGSALLLRHAFYVVCAIAKVPAGKYRMAVLAFSAPFDLRSPSARIMVSNIIELDWPGTAKLRSDQVFGAG